MSLLAIGWEPELRGILTVIIGVVILCGSVYGILATNLGYRLAFLLAAAGVMGWMTIMALVWMIYGIGLRGPDPSWQAVPGAGVLEGVAALDAAGALDPAADVPDDATAAESAAIVRETFLDQGWVVLDQASPAFGQAQSSASELLIESGAFSDGQFAIVEIFDIGGDRYPKINDTLDFIAFFHEPHYVVAEAAALVPVRTEDGRAPASPEIDEDRPATYVYMVRDLGARRQPAAVLLVGGGSIFLALCYLLHRRDRILRENLAMPLPTAAKIEATAEPEKVEAGV